MHDYEVPAEFLEPTDQERAEHKLIERYLDDEELMSVALACDKDVSNEDVILSQLYFARAKRDGDNEALGLLAEIVDDRLKIISVKLGRPDFVFYA